MRFVVLLPVVALLLAACGDDTGAAGGAGAEPTRGCPAYAEVSGPVGDAANDRFIVQLSTGSDLLDDRGARADLLRDVGDRLCLELTELDLLAPGAFLVGTDRLLDARGQTAVTTALDRLDGVDYAEPDGLATPDATLDAVPDGGSAP